MALLRRRIFYMIEFPYTIIHQLIVPQKDRIGKPAVHIMAVSCPTVPG